MNKLFKTNSKGQVQSWEVVVEGNFYYEITGIKTLTRHKPKFATVKNVGKKNEVSPEEQAKKEAKVLWTKKISEGYSETIQAYNPIEEPVMLAKTFQDEIAFVKQQLKAGVRMYAQPKIDGVRGKHLGFQLFSRKNTQLLSCPHLYTELPYILDGELYNHSFNGVLSSISGLVAKKTITEEILEQTKILEYWVYDIVGNEEIYSKRYAKLKKLFKNLPSSFKLVPSIRVKSFKHIEKLHDQFVLEGYEGLILRLDNAGYEFKRTKQLIKYKHFQDSEFKIVGVNEGVGNRTGTAGEIVCITPEGKTFKSNPVGNREYITNLWNTRDTLIGKLATIKYVKLNENGIPRDHTCIAIRDYE